jgi:hypothetical protein
VLYLALKPLGAAEMLEPTLARLLSPIPRAALPSWTACQHELYEVLGLHGTDRTALATARVLRVVGILHDGTGSTIRGTLPRES